MMNLGLEYLKNNDVLAYFFIFEMQKRCFPRFFVFSVLYSISVIFPCFPYRGKLATLYYILSFGMMRKNMKSDQMCCKDQTKFEAFGFKHTEKARFLTKR